MSLLTMDLAKAPTDGRFAGFTLEYTGANGVTRPIQNLLNFQGSDEITTSVDSPLQTFKWVHFPGSYSAKPLPLGDWIYHATPRFFDTKRKLIKIDRTKTVSVEIPVGDFEKGKVQIGFTRAFLKSQAYARRYGLDTPLRPKGSWLFDTQIMAGKHNGKEFTYEEMYFWLGYTARRQLYDFLDEAISNKSTQVEVFAYDLNDPGTAERCLTLASEGRIRIILDNASLHVTAKDATKKRPEDEFEAMFVDTSGDNDADILRCRFGRYSHCKVFILKNKAGKAIRVLTGSTNFAVTGLCVNANHVIIFDDPRIAQYYSDVFNVCWETDGRAAAFRKTAYARKVKTFNEAPRTEIHFSPHDAEYAENLLDSITNHIQGKSIKSVLFAVMEMGATSGGSLIPALKALHKDDSIYTYGVTDKSSGQISLYKPGRKNGLLIDAKAAKRELPPPFRKEEGLPGHAIHHKFVITNFNRSTARVYCGSSNLALGGEKENSDNLLCIHDEDVATAFAIEAMRLTDHYNFRSVKDPNVKPKNQKPARLDTTGTWVDKFFDPGDIRFVEREVL